MDEINKQKLRLLGQKFKSARLKKRMSQADLAYKIGKDQPSINRLEKGRINPSYLYLLEVCKGLEINLKDIVSIF